MAYCNLQNLKDRFPEATIASLSDDQDGSNVDEDIIDELIADADELIDDALRTRYSLPLTSVPGSLTRLACDLVYYYLWARRTDEIPEHVTNRFDNATDKLARLAAGDVILSTDYATKTSKAYRTNKSLTKNQEFDLVTLGQFYTNNENNIANADY